MERKTIRINESEVHKIIAETVAKILDEAYNTGQYAYLSGAADKAMQQNKMKAITNPKWYARKKRQAELFGNAALGHADANNYSNSDMNSKTGESMHKIVNNNNPKYVNDFTSLEYSPEDQKKNRKLTGYDSPFVAKRSQSNPGYEKVNGEMNWSKFAKKGDDDGTVVSPWDEKFTQEHGRGMGKTQSSLTRAYQSGRGDTGKPLNFHDIKPMDIKESVLDSIVDKCVNEVLGTIL